MSDDVTNLSPGSRPPKNGEEMDELLRRVPEVALLSEFAAMRFGSAALAETGALRDRARIRRLADDAYLERLRGALGAVVRRAVDDRNGGLHFVAASLLHFLTSLPAERHPLIVALYFLTLSGGDADEERPEVLAARMDAYEEVG